MPLSTTLQLLTLTLSLLSQLTSVGDIQAPRAPQLQGLPELSGLTLTHSAERGEAVMWGHNDSGHKAEVVALNTQGERLLTVELEVEVLDLEDIDSAPCPPSLGQQTCLWLADVGDNHGRREHVQLIVFPVPELSASSKGHTVTLNATQLLTIPFRYPKGARPNVEAMTVTQRGEVWLFEKSDERELCAWAGRLSEGETSPQLTLQPPQRLTLRQTSYPTPEEARLSRVTGADLSDDGETLALRTYGAVYLFNAPHPISLAELPWLTSQMIEIPQRLEPQGESVTLDLDHKGLWTASEQKGNHTQRLLFTSLSELGA